MSGGRRERHKLCSVGRKTRRNGTIETESLWVTTPWVGKDEDTEYVGQHRSLHVLHYSRLFPLQRTSHLHRNSKNETCPLVGDIVLV